MSYIHNQNFFQTGRRSSVEAPAYKHAFEWWLYLACCNSNCSSPYLRLFSNPSVSSMIDVGSDRFPFPRWDKVKDLWLIGIKRFLSWWTLPLASRLTLIKTYLNDCFMFWLISFNSFLVFVNTAISQARINKAMLPKRNMEYIWVSKNSISSTG